MTSFVPPAVSAAEVRSNVAATAASVIPFHCIICFDEFDTMDRPPMVLPCGHTYVCKPCSKRLKRCMECREPLFVTVTLPTTTSAAHHQQQLPEPPAIMQSYSNGNMPSPNRIRGKPLVRPPGPSPLLLGAPQHQQVPLPIPKNLVLLAMMEAAELQKARTTGDGQYQENAGREEMRKQQEDNEHDEEIRVVAGMATMAGPCGTYAVRDRQGLVVLAHDPRIQNTIVLKESSASNVSATISASDSFLDHHPGLLSSPSSDDEDDLIEEHKSATSPRNIENHLSFRGKPKDGKGHRVVYGQKLQVVSFEDHVATLARNQGFVVANHSQLVKVGGPLDESCFLEGLLDTVSAQGRDLQLHLKENDKLEATLQEQVRNVQKKTPTHPVISASPPAPPQDMTPQTPSRNSSSSNYNYLHPKTPDYNSVLQPSLNSPPDTMPALRPSLSGDRKTTPYLRGACPPMPESPASIDNADIAMPTRRAAVVDNNGQSSLSLACGSAFSDFLSHHEEPPTSPMTSPLVVRGLAAQYREEPEKRQRSSSACTLSPQTPQQSRYPLAAPSSSFDSVDFRTGLSGHYGLATASRRNFKHSPNTQQQQQRGRRMMGVHGGIGGSIARQRASAASYNHWGVTSSFNLS